MTHTRSKMTPDDGALDQKWQHVEGGAIRHGGLTLRLAHTSSKSDGGGGLVDADDFYVYVCGCGVECEGENKLCPLHAAAEDLLTALELAGEENKSGVWHSFGCAVSNDLSCVGWCSDTRDAIKKARGA